MDTATFLPLALTLLVGVALGALVGALWVRSRAAGGPGPAAITALQERAGDRALVEDGLERLEARMRELQDQRVSWQSMLDQQVSDMRHSTDTLRRETQSLATALRRPQVRGQWGELHLRRAVEIAGMVDRCDFTEQHRLDDGALRPDLVVHLAAGRSIVVDSKAPLDAFLDAGEAEDDDERAAHLARHVRQVRTHVDQLADKRYWRSLEIAPDFVVLFLPSESVLSAALETDRDLLEFAHARHVVLATPTTLIALLRTVAQGWRHEALAEQTREVHRLGRELHERLGTMSSHLDKLGRSLTGAVEAYNRSVGSLEGRVLVTGRRLGELGDVDGDLPSPRQVEVTTRALSLAPTTANDAPEPVEGPARRAHGA